MSYKIGDLCGPLPNPNPVYEATARQEVIEHRLFNERKMTMTDSALAKYLNAKAMSDDGRVRLDISFEELEELRAALAAKPAIALFTAQDKTALIPDGCMQPTKCPEQGKCVSHACDHYGKEIR